MAITNVYTGATANDGTGDPIRTAFTTVNENFDLVQAGLFAGTEPVILSASQLTTEYIISNTYALIGSYVNADSMVANTVTSNGNLFVSSEGAYIIGNVSIVGNLNVTGAQQSSQSSNSTAPIILIHSNGAPYTSNDGKDIGIEWQYFKTADRYAFLGWQNSTESLVYLDNVTDTANVITAGTPGNVQFGQLLLSNTTAATSNVSGALQVRGGAGVQGNLFVQSNLFVGNTANVGNLTVRGFHVGSMYFTGGDTIFINGSPVQTAATAFNGGTVGLATTFACTTPSTSTTTGAVILSGGMGVAGNLTVGGNIFLVQTSNSSSLIGNVAGNILQAVQPFVTGLGTLTSLTMGGTINAQDISPRINLTYKLGTGTGNRWSEIWTADMNLSGTLTGGTINTSGNVGINTSGAAALTTTTAVGEIFNTNATTIRIGAAGVTEFDNNTQATSSTTGAVQITGGMSINTGNLYIRGSGGNSLIATGRISIDSNVQATSTSTGALKVNGGISITTGNLYIGGSQGTAIVATGNIVPSSNIAVANNIGSDTAWWNKIYGVSVQAQYADLAENYVADQNYEPGTVVIFGGTAEITTTNQFGDTRVAGCISNNPAYLMNATQIGLPVALRGRVPLKVVGPVCKGDLLVTSFQPGYAQSVGKDKTFGVAVFAKSLTDDSSDENKVIEAVII